MQRDKITKITIRPDYPTGISSTLHGANINSLGFNSDFIVSRDPILAVKLEQLYKKAWALRDKEPLDHDDPKFTKASHIFFTKVKE